MSYEGELAVHYNDVHKRLLGSPPLVKKTPPLVPPISPDKNSQESLLLRIHILEEENKTLHKRLDILEVKNEWRPNLIPHIPQKSSQGSDICIDDIFQMVETKEQFSRILLLSQQRFQRLALARNIIYYLCAVYTCRSLPQIGHFMRRDHTTVLYGRDKIAGLRKVDVELDLKLKWYEVEIARLTEAKNRP